MFEIKGGPSAGFTITWGWDKITWIKLSMLVACFIYDSREPPDGMRWFTPAAFLLETWIAELTNQTLSIRSFCWRVGRQRMMQPIGGFGIYNVWSFFQFHYSFNVLRRSPHDIPIKLFHVTCYNSGNTDICITRCSRPKSGLSNKPSVPL